MQIKEIIPTYSEPYCNIHHADRAMVIGRIATANNNLNGAYKTGYKKNIPIGYKHGRYP